MPTYACDECDKAFKRKDALREHMEQHGDGSVSTDRFSLPDISWQDIRGKLTKRNIGLLMGVFLMSTLFLGTAQFMASTSPGGGGGLFGGGSNDAPDRDETSPPAGFSVTGPDDVDVSQDELPAGQVSDEWLPPEVQLHLLMQGGQQGQPAVLLQYNCPDGCPELVDELEQVAQDFDGWVYVAPYQEMDERVAMTAFRQIERMDTFDRSRAETFICNSLQNQPLACALD